MTEPSTTCRLLPFASADGPHNMAADEILLENAAAGAAALRFYAWDVPTVSLGYFQPAAVRLGDPLLASLPFVRRPSGGATLVHHLEVTYCLALPPGPPWQQGEPWLNRMHRIVAAALQPFGVRGRPHAVQPEDARIGFLCFRHFTAGDLMIGPAKVVGSAQRKYRGALMQHGAILLAQSPYTPSLPGIRDLCGSELSSERVVRAVTEEFSRDTGWTLLPAEGTEAERERIRRRAREKYAAAEWNLKR